MTGATLVQEAIPISDVGDLSAARLMARSMSAAIGFDKRAVEEITLVVSELATNLVKHAKNGVLRLRRIEEAGKTGIQIDSEDQGPGIPMWSRLSPTIFLRRGVWAAAWAPSTG